MSNIENNTKTAGKFQQDLGHPQPPSYGVEYDGRWTPITNLVDSDYDAGGKSQFLQNRLPLYVG